VLKKALASPEVQKLQIVKAQPDALEWLESMIKAEIPNGQEFLRIVLAGDEPEELAVLVTAIRDAYLNGWANKTRIGQQNPRREMEKFRSSIEDRLKVQQARLEKLARKAGPADARNLAEKNRFQLERMNEATKVLFQYQKELRELEAEVKLDRAREKEIP